MFLETYSFATFVLIMSNVGVFLCFFFPVCDPVMGDDGKFYVTPELVPVYREKVLV